MKQLLAHLKPSRSLLALCLMAAVGTTTTLCLSACDKESPAEAFEKEEKVMTEYWGENYSYLNGIWIEEEDKSNPSAGYTVIEPGRHYKSVNMVVPGRVASGGLSFYHSETHAVKFDEGNYYSLKWVNASHTRIEVYNFNPYTDEVGKELVTVWIKVSSIPSGWNK